MKGTFSGQLKTIAVDADGYMIAKIRDGDDDYYAAIDNNGYLAAVMKGDNEGTLRTLAVDSGGRMLALMKGAYGATLKTVATDKNGVMQALVARMQDYFMSSNSTLMWTAQENRQNKWSWETWGALHSDTFYRKTEVVFSAGLPVDLTPYDDLWINWTCTVDLGSASYQYQCDLLISDGSSYSSKSNDVQLIHNVDSPFYMVTDHADISGYTGDKLIWLRFRQRAGDSQNVNTDGQIRLYQLRLE